MQFQQRSHALKLPPVNLLFSCGGAFLAATTTSIRKDTQMLKVYALSAATFFSLGIIFLTYA